MLWLMMNSFKYNISTLNLSTVLIYFINSVQVYRNNSKFNIYFNAGSPPDSLRSTYVMPLSVQNPGMKRKGKPSMPTDVY